MFGGVGWGRGGVGEGGEGTDVLVNFLNIPDYTVIPGQCYM